MGIIDLFACDDLRGLFSCLLTERRFFRGDYQLGANQLYPFILTGFFGGALTIVVVWLLSKISGALGLVDVPDSRKRHGEIVPLVGGIAIYTVLLGLAVITGHAEKGVSLILGCSIIVLSGSLDDMVGLSVTTRLVCQGIAASLVLLGGDLWITNLGFNSYLLSDLPSEIGILLTVFWVVGLTNAFNMADGIDGLSIGYFLVALSGVLFVYLDRSSDMGFPGYLLVVFCVTAAVGLVNLRLIPLRRVFLGDAGSMLLGFSVAWIVVFASQKDFQFTGLLVMIWFVSLPIADTLIVMMRRFLAGRSIFSPDREHIHHLLVEVNFSERQALLLLMLVALSANIIGLYLFHLLGPMASLVGFIFWIILIGSTASLLKYLSR